MKKILFISGSFGLGHIVRDLQIASDLRRQIPDTRITWIAGEPARTVLVERKEEIHPASNTWASETNILEHINEESRKRGRPFRANLMSFLLKCRKAWENNVEVFDAIMKNEKYDLVVGDESYELTMALLYKKIHIMPTYVILFDFLGADVVSNNPRDRLIAYLLNFVYVNLIKKVPQRVITGIFFGEVEDIPDKSFGFLLPNRRESMTRRENNIVGNIVQFDPDDYRDKQEIRRKLGLGPDPLIVCSIGGTSIGLPLLELCCRAFPLIKRIVPSAKMYLFPGPRISPDHFSPIEGITVKEYLPNLYEYFAACDLAIVQAGGSTTLELVALNKPFLYFPLEGHFEQQVHVAGRLERLHAGVKMQFSQTTPETLATKAALYIGTRVNYPAIPLDGAKNTVKVLRQILGT